MKIAIDVSPLSSGHAIRGVGFYLKNLLKALRKYHPEHEYSEFTHSLSAVSNADVVHYPYFDPFFLTLPFFTSKKIVVTVHDLTPLILPGDFPVGVKGKIAWEIQKYALKRAQRIITDSQVSKRDIERLTGISSGTIDSVYLAAGEQFIVLPENKVSSVRKKYHVPDVFALYVGDGTANKNLPRLVKAMSKENIHLVMVGKSLVDESVDLSNVWTKDIQDVRSLAKANPQEISLLGFISDDDLVGLYNAASVFVMPSLYEGFGLPILEAFSCGCPVVTSEKGSLQEIAGGAAHIIDPYDIESIANGAKKVLQDKKYAHQLREAGLRRSKDFSWEKTAQETVASYEKVGNRQ